MTRSRGAGPKQGPDGRWFFVVDLGTGPDGRRRQARRRGFATKREAQKALDELRVAGRNGVYVRSSSETVGEYLTEWLLAIRPTVEPATWESYERNIGLHVAPRIGRTKLQALTPMDLSRLYADLLEAGRRDGKGGLSARTVRYISTVLHRALRQAVAWQRLAVNPTDAAEPPSARSARAPEMQVWDASELARFLEATADHRHGVAWQFLATTGCRRGEALGLRWRDLDLDAGRAAIRQTVLAIRHEIHVRPLPKTGKPRTVNVPPLTVAGLRQHRRRQAEARLAVGAGYAAAEDLVFAGPAGEPLHPKNFSSSFDWAVKRLGVRRTRLHDLRHGWATLALGAGVDVRIVSEQLGHSSTNTTWTTYQHVTPRMTGDAVERVAELVFGPTGMGLR